MSDLTERLRSWAQNEEMINQYFTDHGKDCNEAVKEIERLQARVDALEGANARQFKLIETIRSNVKAALAATSAPSVVIIHSSEQEGRDDISE